MKTEKELLDWIRDWVDEHGEIPTTKDVKEHGPLSTAGYRYRFGSWSEAVEAAGFTLPPSRGKTYTPEELLEWIDAFVLTFGVVPSTNDFRGGPGPSPTTYETHFGGFGNAVKEAGYTPRSER